jgi:hypothetical protein
MWIQGERQSATCLTSASSRLPMHDRLSHSRLWRGIYFGVSCLLICVGGKQIALGDGGSALGAIKCLTHISTRNGTTRAIQKAPEGQEELLILFMNLQQSVQMRSTNWLLAAILGLTSTQLHISLPSLCPTFLLSPMVKRVGSNEFRFGMQINLNMAGAIAASFLKLT